MDTLPSLQDFPAHASDTIRFADTDAQGHVNNAVFSIFLETGRTHILYASKPPFYDPGCSFVIARLVLDFRAEVMWPGTVEIGTKVGAIGRSSVTLVQGVFQNGRCVATAETVMVQMDGETRKSRPLSADAVARLTALM